MVMFFSILILISSIALIVSVLFQESKSEGLGAAYGGTTESFFSRSGSRTIEAMLAKVTTVSAIVFMISAIVLAAIH